MFQKGDGILAETPFVQFLAGFRAHFDEVVLISRVFPFEGQEDATYEVPMERVRVEALPAYPKIASLYLHPLRYRSSIDAVLTRTIPELDALWLNFGHPVSLRAAAIAKKYPSLRCFGVMRGAYERDARMRTGGPRVVGALAGRVMERNLGRFARIARRRSMPCFAYGAELTERLERWGLTVFPLVDSLIRVEDVARAAPFAVEDHTDLLFVGRMTPEKGGDTLIKALARMDRVAGEAVTLRMVGSGPEQATWQALADELQVADKIRWDGHVEMGPELFSRYLSAKIFVMPSRTEGMPKTAFEAMRFGLPVVASEVGGLPEIVGDREDRGRLVPIDDAQALAKTLNDLLTQPDNLYKMGRNARTYAVPFTLEAQVEQMMNCLQLSQ